MARSPVELVIFDCDGVLVDSERICVRGDVMAMADPGCAFSEGEIVERFVGSRTTVFDDMRELPGLPAAVTH